MLLRGRRSCKTSICSTLCSADELGSSFHAQPTSVNMADADIATSEPVADVQELDEIAATASHDVLQFGAEDDIATLPTVQDAGPIMPSDLLTSDLVLAPEVSWPIVRIAFTLRTSA